MQVLFKTSYDQDIDHLPKRGEKIRVGLALLAAALLPLLVDPYYLTEIGMLFVYIVAGVGLMLLVGFTGQVSFGHSAFLGIGAYGHAVFLTMGLPFLVSLALSVALAGIAGLILGRSASRMHGFYLAIATLVFAVLVETMIGEWEHVTGGHAGIAVPDIQIFGLYLTDPAQQYYLDLVITVFVLLAVANLMRGPTGRAFQAIRDSELSARSLGVNVAWHKIKAFGLSAAITGMAGVLMAHHLFYLSPETFGINESLRLLLMVVVGGMGSLLGAVLGAIFITALPFGISLLRSALPDGIANQAGLEPLLFGVVIVLVLIYEPEGMAGRWHKFRLFLETFPYYKRASFVRQKSYLKTERMR
ncbi:branched-chain amino acid ABC transporter permease [Mameliella alba]|nr:branched-chain amino acid ABC transporter permease [Mameliella alba]MCA0956764.1 branched-chain amino acid ABC transporter permease [Mameliella alba]